MCASKIVLQLLLFFGSFGLVFAERRTQFHQRVLATLGDEADFGKSTQAVEPCPQEEPLTEVLLTLGFKESELTDLHNMEKYGEKVVTWEGCKVVKIELWGSDKLTGSLSPHFSELPDLQGLDLGDTKVWGDISALENLTELTWLNLEWTQVSGNIEALQNLRKLEFLFLQGTHVIGDISALKNLTKLTELNLPSTKVSGNLLALKNLTKLEELGLAKTKVFGNITALKTLTKLSKLNLAETNVIGDMSSLRSTSLGDNFDIKGTKITCDEAALRAVLRSLGLQAEQLTDLMNFEGVKRHNCWVVEIDLSNRSDVSGSLDKDFKELKDLKQLNLENTKTSGDIAMLLQNTKLDYLNLHNTSVLGDLAALQRATKLKDSSKFEVSNTGITCPQDAAGHCDWVQDILPRGRTCRYPKALALALGDAASSARAERLRRRRSVEPMDAPGLPASKMT